MNERSPSRVSGADPDGRWEARMRITARTFTYPATPDIAASVRQRLGATPPRPASRRWRLVWVAVVALVILSGLLAVPQARAALTELLRIGAVHIFLTQPPPTATPLPALTEVSPTGTPRPTAMPLSSVLEVAGETTLTEAQAQVDFPIRLPSYPSDLGPPDRVFLQDLAGPVVVLVWLDVDHPDRVRLSLHQLGPDTFARKVVPQVVQETTVNGQPALWTEGPYLLHFEHDGQVVEDTRRLVKGHILIWVDGEITYRLETDLSLEEAVRIAESLK